MIALPATAWRPRRVLIIKPSSLGDVVGALPVLHGLRRTFPRAHLAWLLSTACAPLLADERDLDEIILFDRTPLGRSWRSPSAARGLLALLRALKAGRFDWVIDLQGLLRSGLFAAATGAALRAGFGEAREGAAAFYTRRIHVSARHTVDRNIELARALGADARPEDMTLAVGADARRFAETICRRHRLSGGDFLVCVPPTRWPTKLYPVRHWQTVAGKLSRKAPLVLLGAPADRELCARNAKGAGPAVIDLSGRTSLTQMAAVIAASAGVICSDSAAKFIAPAVGVEAITLIGPTRIELTGPYLRGQAVVADVPCRGCLRRRCRHVSCMQLLDPARVVRAATSLLDERGD